MPAQAEKREALSGAFAECLILLGENGEVQDFLNFVVQGFRIFAILAALSGEKKATKNYKPWYNMRYERQR